MKFIIFILLFLSIYTSSAQLETKTPSNRYVLFQDNDGILVEQFDSTITDINKYNFNNNIYKVGHSFKYKYEHKTIEEEIKYFKLGKDLKSWEFVSFDIPDSKVIKSVTIEVVNGNPMSSDPDYNQTGLLYKLNDDDNFSISGAIENEANIWIHPPRDNYFRILELNPFPYIKSPYEIGTKWNWNLSIGSFWGDVRWKTWEGNIENKYQYEIIDKQLLKTELGNLECYIVESKALSRIGETKLTAYFNIKYGFVKLDYTNIDGSQTILELIEFTKT